MLLCYNIIVRFRTKEGFMKHSVSQNMKRCNHLQGEIEAAYHEAALKFGLADSTQFILYTICYLGDNCPLGDIVKMTGISKQTINSALRNMEKQGLISLSAATPKTKNVILTPKGEELAERTVLRLMKAEDEIFASWSDEDVKKYLELNEKFLNDLKEKVDKL